MGNPSVLFYKCQANTPLKSCTGEWSSSTSLSSCRYVSRVQVKISSFGDSQTGLVVGDPEKFIGMVNLMFSHDCYQQNTTIIKTREDLLYLLSNHKELCDSHILDRILSKSEIIDLLRMVFC